MGQIYDITPFTQLDFPGELACIVWFSGCNLRCAYCHNPDIVLKRGDKEADEVVSFLQTRQGKLTGVVFSGGEATFCPALPDLARQAKAMGFKTKLDTNGSNFDAVRDLVEEGSLDSVALDYKCPPHLAEKLIGTARFNEPFRQTLDYLIAASRIGKVLFETRTTVAFDYMAEDDIAQIIEDLGARGYQGIYWLQNVVASGEKTLGNIPAPGRSLDRSRLPEPKGFKLGFRNFAEALR
ncbi:MAG: anaerobic ribonucleoside-triphosphate reductase activating protein [Alphaproteobacteria bacterium]|nr:anaerobic ribonucleoside-triphosphate reductase activating protein [Alphaproteobacteria bacterium]